MAQKTGSRSGRNADTVEAKELRKLNEQLRRDRTERYLERSKAKTRERAERIHDAVRGTQGFDYERVAKRADWIRQQRLRRQAQATQSASAAQPNEDKDKLWRYEIRLKSESKGEVIQGTIGDAHQIHLKKFRVLRGVEVVFEAEASNVLSWSRIRPSDEELRTPED